VLFRRRSAPLGRSQSFTPFPGALQLGQSSGVYRLTPAGSLGARESTTLKPSIFIAVIVAAIRPLMLFVDVNSHLIDGYKDFAHLFVGGLIGVWLVQGGKISWLIPTLLYRIADRSASWQIRTASALSIVEIVCATITALRG
jgi:hypothetical protein